MGRATDERPGGLLRPAARLALFGWLLAALGCGADPGLDDGEACTSDAACASRFCQPTTWPAGDASACADPDEDSDGDGLDAVSERAAGTNPAAADSDGDGLGDKAEVGPSPAAALDRDGDGKPDAIEHNTEDADKDCLADVDDASDDVPASKEALAVAFCQQGVCAGNTPRATCLGEVGVVACEVTGTPHYEAGDESRCDGRDNDCDGQTDEGLDGKAGAFCGASGLCLDAPTSRCVGGQWVCNLSGIQGYETIEKTCDGIDNDCDGQTDEAPICDDGVACTEDTCAAGVGCRHTPSAKRCNDGNPCTVDLCELPSGCRSLPHIGTCDDGNPCTVGESCAGGSCTGGTPTICDDGNPCTVDTCAPDKGCAHVALPEGTACKPTDLCQQAGTCIQGACDGYSAIQCDDNNPCTDDACDPKVGTCGHSANTASCNDGNPCTSGDSCLEKLCVGVPLPSCCTADADCGDDNPCTADLCQGGACASDLAAATGQPCDDGNPCTEQESCSGGLCGGGVQSACDDDDACTLDVCKVVGGAKDCSQLALPDGANCDDGDVCNGFGACTAGKCVASAALDCDDGNPCTSDSCDSQKGCAHAPHLDACDDGNACTTGDTCKSGACLGKALVCDDLNPCTTDTCTVDSGCAYVPAPGACDDGDACTSGDTCTGGACVGGAADCDDQQPCTVDTCTASGACTHDASATEGTGCDDGDACTLGDTCKSGACTAGVQIDCDDGNSCTVNTCDKISGLCKLSFKQGSCVTPTGCTADAVCQQGLCQGKAIAGCCKLNGECNDQNPCTIDSCDKGAGTCSHVPVSGLACSDGSQCSVGDACAGGLCQGKAVLGCDDHLPCTADFCLAKEGCKHLAVVSGSCSDGNPCNGEELCGPSSSPSGTCKPGTAPDCDDDNPCTLDLCDETKGCTNAWKPPGTACDDGSACTKDDACDGKGSCKGSPVAGPGCCAKASDCDDGYACTKDACDPTTSRCAHTALSCVPGAACTAGWCETGTCKSASRCLLPVGYEQNFDAQGLPGWQLGVDAPPASAGVGWANEADGGASSGGKLLRCALATGTFTAQLPPMALSKGPWRVKLDARIDVDTSDCSQGALRVLLDGKPIAGGQVCTAKAKLEALDLPLDVTVDGATVTLAVQWVAVASKPDKARGAWLDSVRLVADAKGDGCACAP